MQVTNPPNIRLTHALGGGALMDVGIYCLNAARYITGEEPTEVSAMLWSDPNDPRFREVEQSIQFQLRFPGGALAQCNASFDCAVSRSYRVYCEDGWYELDPAFAYEGLRLHIGKEKSSEEIILPQVDQFAKEMDHLSECIADNKTPWTPGEEGLADIRLMMRIYEAAHGGKTVKV